MALPRQQRLTRGALIAALARAPLSAQNSFATLRVERADGNQQQCAVVIPRRVSASAVRRNGLRRKVVAVIARIIPRTQKGWRGLVMIRHERIPAGALLGESFFELFNKSGIVQK